MYVLGLHTSYTLLLVTVKVIIRISLIFVFLITNLICVFYDIESTGMSFYSFILTKNRHLNNDFY